MWNIPERRGTWRNVLEYDHRASQNFKERGDCARRKSRCAECREYGGAARPATQTRSAAAGSPVLQLRFRATDTISCGDRAARKVTRMRSAPFGREGAIR